MPFFASSHFGLKPASLFPAVSFLVSLAFLAFLSGFCPRDARAAEAAKSDTLQDFSQESQAQYVKKLRQWLDSLPNAKQENARAILRAARPELHALREQIRAKTAQLASLSYDKDTPPQALARLGQKLQKLRATLREKLLRLDERLRHELDLSLGPLASEGLWLNTEPEGAKALD